MKINKLKVSDISKINYLLDMNKYELFEKGVTFDFAATLPDGTEVHTGIGASEQMCALVLMRAADLFRTTEGKISVEDFAESVKQNLIRWLNDHPVVIGEINVLPKE